MVEKNFWPGISIYPHIVSNMERYVEKIALGKANEAIWGVEHEHVYTAGTSAQLSELINPSNFPVYLTGRGGRYTYHGPGQLVVYPMLNISHRKVDIRQYIKFLERRIQEVLRLFGIDSETHPEHIGLWVKNQKIAAIGVRVSRGVSWHGFAINVSPNLDYFKGIVPCGLKLGVTSMAQLGYTGGVLDVWEQLARLPWDDV